MNENSYIKLSELTLLVEETIRQNFGEKSYWVVAEISSHKFYENQERHYFELIEKAEGSGDPIAKVRGVSWRNSSRAIKLFETATGQKFTNGIQVLVKVKLEFHQAYGLSLVLIDIDPTFTLGNLERQRRETLLRLVEENPEWIRQEGDEFITGNKKLPLPAVLQNIAIIGSPNSEGYTDFTHTLSTNQFNYKFTLDVYPSAVQGIAAENELIDKLVALFCSGKPYDCVVIVRGGGSKTDFLVFDSYDLARSVARFPIPVLTGIGHHRDISIVDLMAHTSLKTPTRAAEFIISHNRAFEEAVLLLQNTVIIRSQQLLAHSLQGINRSNLLIVNKSGTLINHKKDAMNGLNQVVINKTKTILYNRQTHLVALLNQLLLKPKMILAGKSTGLKEIAGGIKNSSRQFLERQEHFLDHSLSVVTLMNPVNLLKKGFALISKNGKILKDAEGVSPGDEVSISMHDYTIHSTVHSKSKTDATKSNL